MVNYYTILELSNFSSLDDIRKAHRKLSLKYHPDLNNGNKASEEKFKIIQNAYEHLSTEEKKQMHDNFLRAALYNQQTNYSYQTYTQQVYQQQQHQQYHQQTYPTQQSNRSFRFPWFFVIFIGMSLLRLCTQSTNDIYNNIDYNTNVFSNQKDYLDSLEEQQNPGVLNSIDTINNTLPVNNNAFGIGSSSSKVLEVQGKPTLTHLADDGKQILYYKNSYVSIENDVVTGFSNLDSNLKISLSINLNKEENNAVKNFTIGSSKDDVLTLQGMPSSITKNDFTNEYEWRYGKSYVLMKNDFVANYLNTDNNLKIVK